MYVNFYFEYEWRLYKGNLPVYKHPSFVCHLNNHLPYDTKCVSEFNVLGYIPEDNQICIF